MGRKKLEKKSVKERIALILNLEKILLTKQLKKNERFNIMHKRNTLKRELRKEGHDISKNMSDLVQPKLTNWLKANHKLSIVDIVINSLLENEKFKIQFKKEIDKQNNKKIKIS